MLLSAAATQDAPCNDEPQAGLYYDEKELTHNQHRLYGREVVEGHRSRPTGCKLGKRTKSEDDSDDAGAPSAKRRTIEFTEPLTTDEVYTNVTAY